MIGHIASIAVLPFECQGANVDIAYFARGFSEDLIAQLTRFQALRVVSSLSSFSIQLDNPGDGAEVARQWGVDYLLEGGIRLRDDTLRVSTRLVQVVDMKVVWADQMDVQTSDLFHAQDQIVSEIVGKLSIQVSERQLSGSRTAKPDELEAYDYWLRGMDCLRQASVEGDAEARPLFEQAIAIDPHFALGYVGLSLSHFNEWSCQTWHLWDE
ncbi:MAG: hypothetical protein ACYTGQ_09455, partial [Planctomycetota bacterium]